jgi:signal transduction histidine kinase
MDGNYYLGKQKMNLHLLKWLMLSLAITVLSSYFAISTIYSSYWGGADKTKDKQGTIYSVQTVEFNISEAAFPYKLSKLLELNQKEEIQQLLNSTYGLLGFIVTDCTNTIGVCSDEKILYKTDLKDDNNKNKAWWLEKFIKDGSYKKADFGLLQSPAPIYQQWEYKEPKDATKIPLLPDNHPQNLNQIIGRIYYVRNEIPSLSKQLTYWASKHFFPTSTDAKYYTLITIELLIINLLTGISLWWFDHKRNKADKKQRDESDKALKLEHELRKEEVNRTKMEEKHRHELEDLMAMFAHKFRGPLDSLDFNFQHGLEKSKFIRALETMRGLLDTFSIISTNPENFKKKLRIDSFGSQTIEADIVNSLEFVLSHLTTIGRQSYIRQHYFDYARKQNLIDDSVNIREWNADFFDKEAELQKIFSDKVFDESNSKSLCSTLFLVEQLFFKLELNGFDDDDIRYAPFGVKSSFLTILFSEIFTNAFKYYHSSTKESVIMNWTVDNSYVRIECYTPSNKLEYNNMKGSGKGHHFLKTISEMVGGSFNFSYPQVNSNLCITEISLPRNLFLNSEAKV